MIGRQYSHLKGIFIFGICMKKISNMLTYKTFETFKKNNKNEIFKKKFNM